MTSQLLIPLLTFVAVMALGGSFVVARSARRHALRARLAAGLDEFDEVGQSGRQDHPLLALLRRLGTIAAPTGPSAELRQQLARAGYFARTAAPAFIGAKLLLLVLGIALSIAASDAIGLAGREQVLLLFTLSGSLFFIPNIVVAAQRRARSIRVRNHLPDMVDLLEICVTAGMGLDMAWNAVGGEVRRVSPTLADEMALANLEIHLGATRAEAMRHMAERTGADELSSLVAVLVQSERFGTSLADALTAFASSMRQARSQRAEEIAEKAAVKMLFPLVVFVFPPMLIISAGPAALKIVEIFE